MRSVEVSLVALALFASEACSQTEAARSAMFDRSIILEVEGPTGIALGDLNGDGALDAVVSAGSIHTLLGDGSGGFRAAGAFDAGENPSGVSLGDVDGDGILDLAVANHETDRATVMLGDGAGGFRHAPGSPVPLQVAPHPHAATLADMDGDGRLDLLVDDRAGHAIDVHRGFGDGRFEALGAQIAVGGDPYRGMIAIDVNGDDMLDLLTPNEGHVAVRLAVDPTSWDYDDPGSIAVPGPFSIGVADLNGDGHLDLATASERDGHVRLFPGDGTGSFGPAADSVEIARSEGVALATGDVNADGVADLAATSYTSPDVVIALGGQRLGRSTVQADTYPWGLAIGDVDGDGKDDVIVADDGAGVVFLFLAR